MNRLPSFLCFVAAAGVSLLIAGQASATTLVTSGEVAHYRADQGFSTSGSGATTTYTWQDLSGHGNDATATGANGPTVTNTFGINNLAALQFTTGGGGLNDTLMSAPSLFSGSGARTIFAVYKVDSGASSYTNPIAGPADGASADIWFSLQARLVSGSDPYIAGYIDDVSRGATGSTLAGGVEMATAAYDGSTAYITWDNTSSNYASGSYAYNTGTGSFYIGTDGYGNGFTGQIAELVVYNRALSGPEYAQNQQYFTDRYLTTAAVPEPASFAMIGLGCVGLMARRRHRCR